VDGPAANLCGMASDAQTRLDAYKAAEASLLKSGQAVKVMGREMTRADLGEITRMIAVLQRSVNAEATRASGQLAGFRQANFGGDE
jgi:hypothetical protein